jgi:hypothetical protein
VRISRDMAPPWARLLREAQRPLELPGLTCTRASTATWGGETFGANIPRLRRIFVPGFGALAVAMAEGSRTNVVPRTNPSGASVGVIGSGGGLPSGWTATIPAGVTLTVVAVDPDALTIEWNGTNTAGTEATLRWATSAVGSVVPSTAYTASIDILSVSGTATKLPGLRFLEIDSGSGYLREGGTPLTAGVTNVRLTHTRTAGTSCSRAMLALGASWTGGQTHTFSGLRIRVGVGQVEAGAHASTPIATTGTAATRASDTLSFTASAGQAGTRFTAIAIPWAGAPPATEPNRRAFDLKAGYLSASVGNVWESTHYDADSGVNSLSAGPITSGSTSLTQVWGSTGHRFFREGLLVGSDSAYVDPWSSGSAVGYVGNRAAGDRALFGAVTLMEWPRALSPAEIAALDRALRPLLAQVPLW